ncbi:DUF1801 domain-containing protein [Vibrio paucivorans]
MNKDVQDRFDQLPPQGRSRAKELRRLISSIAEQNHLGPIEESLKWGEISFSVAGGSPIRMDCKVSSPESFFVYFHCQTKLVDTFRELYPNLCTYHGNRALEFHSSEPLSSTELSHCIELALTYHKRKYLPMLGA